MTASTAERAAPARRRALRARAVEERFAPLEAKLTAPPARSGLVSRRALVERLLASAGTPAVTVTAPAGYGKTTLLAQWSCADPRPFGWVSLNESDNDPVELLRYVAIALNRLEPLGGPVFAALAARQPAVEREVVPRLCNAVARFVSPFVLVLDDAHVLASEGSIDVVLALLRHVPAGSQLVLAARSELELPLGRMRAQRALFELGPADLAFDEEAAGALLRSAGIRLSRESVRRLTHRTEGWPAGLYLATLSLRGQGSVAAAEGGFAGDDRLVTDYFRDEVLARSSREVARFLTRTSILSRLSGPLCDAVLQTSGSAARLRKLERSNLFVVPIDRGRVWYRYHKLFAEMLQGRLRESRPELEPALHRRASAWYAEHGEHDEAVRHAQAAGDLTLAGDLIWAYLDGFRIPSRRATVERWLGVYSDDRIAAYPPLALAAAWCALGRGDGPAVERWTEIAASGSLEGPLSDGSTSLASVVALLRAIVARKGIERMRDDAALVRAAEPPVSVAYARACLFGAVAERLAGHFEQARDLVAEAQRVAAACGCDAIHVFCLTELAVQATGEGLWDLAASHVAAAKAGTEEVTMDDHPAAARALALSALVLAHQGRTGEARHELREACRLLTPAGNVSSWFPVEIRLILGRASLAVGDLVAARQLLSDARQRVTPYVDLGSLREDLDRLSGAAGIFPATGVTGPSSLTVAELRLLSYLPTHMSFPEIGRQLHVSRNTVKSQAISIYRKLRVSSRSEAVDRAEACGLLQR
jgi:LuxR family maltose regulon positive regulatory protein